MNTSDILQKKGKKYYLVVIGDLGNEHNGQMKERLKKLKATNILENTYVVSSEYVKEDFCDNNENLRNYIAGKDFGFCLVISMNINFSCAWHLSQKDSDYFKRITTEINGDQR